MNSGKSNKDTKFGDKSETFYVKNQSEDSMIQIGSDKVPEAKSLDKMHESASRVVLEDDSEKENVKKAIRKRKTTKEQLNKIDDFHKSYSEDSMDKVLYGEIWSNVCDDLNLLGPPTHTSTEWKKVWTAHKHNEKKKRLVEGSLNIGRTHNTDQASSQSVTASPQSIQFVQMSSDSVAGADIYSNVDQTSSIPSIQIIQLSSDTVADTGDTDFQSKVMRKLEQMDRKLDKIIEKQDGRVEKQLTS